MSDRVAVLSTRPGRVKEIIAVPFERPLSISAICEDERFGELRELGGTEPGDEAKAGRGHVAAGA